MRQSSLVYNLEQRGLYYTVMAQVEGDIPLLGQSFILSRFKAFFESKEL